MVPAKSWSSPEILKDGFAAFSSVSVNVLNSIIADDDIVMLTTSHKANFSMQEWKDIFVNRGLEIKTIESLPENENHLSRKDEIMNWFDLNEKPSSFVILDDDTSLNDLPTNLKEHLLHTSSTVGLLDKHISEINLILDEHREFA